MSLPCIVILDHRISLHVHSILSSIPCHLEYNLFATILFKLSVQFFLHTPPCSVQHPPGYLLLLAIVYRCLKPVGRCSRPLKASIIFCASRFSLTAFATSSVHHPWFLLLGVPSFPNVLPHSSPATPTNASFYCLHSPSTVPFSASSSSYFLLTLCLFSTII